MARSAVHSLLLILVVQCTSAIRLQPALRHTSHPIRSAMLASEASPPESASEIEPDENAFREKYIKSLTDENGVNTLVRCC